MLTVKRFVGNPILTPNKKNPWEGYAVLNGSVVKKDKSYHMLYRAISTPQHWQDAYMHVSSIGHATSEDGFAFLNRTQFLTPQYDWERFGCEDPRVTYIDDKFVIFYTAIATNPPSPEGIRVGVAITRDFVTFEEKHLVTPFNAKAMALFPKKINGKYTAILTVDTDNPPAKIAIAQFDRLEQLWERAYWENWYDNVSTHTLALLRRSQDHVEVGVVPIETEKGWVLVYSYIQNYFSQHKVFGIEAALLDNNNPLQVVAKTNGPFMVPEAYPELYGTIPNIIFPSGGLVEGDTLRMYYGASDTAICTADVSLSALVADMLSAEEQITIESVHSALHLVRFEGNPILSPISTHQWEEKAVLNAAVYQKDKKIYILYRAMDDAYQSTLGMAVTTDGFHIDERLPQPIYSARADFEKNPHGGPAGCEDPRITQIGDTLFMHYTAYNGKIPRVTHTAISVSDFLARKWQWEKPLAISNPSVMDKNSAVFPEKYQGKCAVLHRLDVRVWLDFVDDFSSFGKSTWLQGEVLFLPRPNMWDSEKVGIAGPPIKTELGWLLIYHGISQRDQKYRLGVILLDGQDPTKILVRFDNPILEPKLQYENHGVRPGAVFSCGSAILNDTFFVYYGAGDSHLCVAQMPFSLLMKAVHDRLQHK